MISTPHSLATDVYMCLSGDRLVFLDLCQNRYFCLDRDNTQIAMRLFRPIEPANATRWKQDTSSIGRKSRVVEALAAKGLIVQGNPGCNCSAPAWVQAPDVTLLVKSEQEPTVRTNYWRQFLQASIKASAKLRWYSMQRTVRSVSKRKMKYVKVEPVDPESVFDLARTFQRLRPIFPRKYRCLYDSLALVEFLALFQHFPQWIFGVKTEPFNAHCWVQEGNFILNDIPENVRTYTPIMRV